MILYNPKATDQKSEDETLVQNLKNEGFVVSDVIYLAYSSTKNPYVKFLIDSVEVLEIHFYSPIHRFLKKNGSCYELKLEQIKKYLDKLKNRVDRETKEKTIAQFRWPMLLAYIENEMSERKLQFERALLLTPITHSSQYFSWTIKNYSINIYIENSVLSKMDFKNVKCNINYKNYHYFHEIPLLKFLDNPNLKQLKKELAKIEHDMKEEEKKVLKLRNEADQAVSDFYIRRTKLEQQKVKELYGK